MLKIACFWKKRNQGGFTLIEALIVVFIMVLLSTLILANYQGNKKKYTLIQANQILKVFLQDIALKCQIA